MNTFVNYMDNIKVTENGATAHKSTTDAVYDLFAFGGAYRNRSDDDCIALFANAYNESPVLAMKCLFYLRDAREGQGERRFFRVCFKWLIATDKKVASKLLPLIAEYGRWDDLIEVTYGTSLWDSAMVIVANQLIYDVNNEDVSLCAKWLPSENASSIETKKKAAAVRRGLKMTPRQYRTILSRLRRKINIVESKMSANDWDSIEFDKLPSKAGMKYSHAFTTREETSERYREFVNDKKTTVNASVAYPYEIVRALKDVNNKAQIAAMDKYWNNLPDYFNGAENSMMCVCDTSGSMTWSMGNVKPIDVAISLSIYAAEHNRGEFANKFITFSRNPRFVNIPEGDIYTKVLSIYSMSICEDTNLEGVFDLLRRGCVNGHWLPEDMPKNLVIISDMEINAGVQGLYWGAPDNAIMTLMESIREGWKAEGLDDYFPNLVYWNVNARNNTILDLGDNVSYVSGCSPVLFEQVVSGKKGIDLMFDKLLSERYEKISF